MFVGWFDVLKHSPLPSLITGYAVISKCKLHEWLDEPGIADLKFSEGTLMVGTFPIISTGFILTKAGPNCVFGVFVLFRRHDKIRVFKLSTHITKTKKKTKEKKMKKKNRKSYMILFRLVAILPFHMRYFRNG